MPASSLRPDLVLFNAKVITLSQEQPAAELVAVQGGRIAWVGTDSDLPMLGHHAARRLDCQGQTLVPGLIDAHCHLLAYASSLLALDCSPGAVNSIADIQRALRRHASKVPLGQWIRATGYDETSLRESRHPSRWDLDEAVPEHPVRLNHRSGHACVLNSLALVRAGISASMPEPATGVIERQEATGQPTGLLLEMDDYLEGRIPPLGEAELRRGVQLASRRLVSLGITSLQDATASNSPQRWELMGRLQREGGQAHRVTMMAGAGYLQGFLERGLGFRSGDDYLNLGAVKVMTTTTTGALQPSVEELTSLVLQAHRAGFQVAIHAVEAEAVEAAAQALACIPPERNRIEHCSECPPSTLAMLAGVGAVVVTQPGFIYYSGQRYLSQVASEMQPWLYRVNSLQKAGLHVAASSDAPVISPDPLAGIYAAVTRRAQTGETVVRAEAISPAEALKMYTVAGAYAAFQEGEKGSIEPGKLADLVLLDQDLTQVEPEQILDTKVLLTVIGGAIVWEA